MGRRITLYNATPAAGAQTLTGATAAGYYDTEYVTAVLNVTIAVASEVGDTLDVYVDTSADAGTTWVNVIHFPQVLGNGGAKRFAVTINPVGAQAASPTDVSADAAANAVRHFVGDAWRYRIVQVDANANANFATSLALFLGSSTVIR